MNFHFRTSWPDTHSSRWHGVLSRSISEWRLLPSSSPATWASTSQPKRSSLPTSPSSRTLLVILVRLSVQHVALSRRPGVHCSLCFLKPCCTGADSVAYLTVEGLISAVQEGVASFQESKLSSSGVSGKTVGHCTACLTGKYPVELEW